MKEQWMVRVGKETIYLDGDEANILKEATERGDRGLIWFKDRAISIPHIESVTLVARKFQQLYEGEFKSSLSKEAIDHRIKELKQKATQLKSD